MRKILFMLALAGMPGVFAADGTLRWVGDTKGVWQTSRAEIPPQTVPGVQPDEVAVTIPNLGAWSIGTLFFVQ